MKRSQVIRPREGAAGLTEGAGPRDRTVTRRPGRTRTGLPQLRYSPPHQRLHRHSRKGRSPFSRQASRPLTQPRRKAQPQTPAPLLGDTKPLSPETPSQAAAARSSKAGTRQATWANPQPTPRHPASLPPTLQPQLQPWKSQCTPARRRTSQNVGRLKRAGRTNKGRSVIKGWTRRTVRISSCGPQEGSERLRAGQALVKE
mmetsp:Transcript_28629/g.54094  ORF Transcript_28629/g.54094 Transcript_28629/m.54094 type:complete len:201 (+) Transcript_28629:294-896(+)